MNYYRRELTKRERIKLFFEYNLEWILSAAMIALFLSLLFAMAYDTYTDCENKLNAPISDEVVSVDGDMEYHISTAGYHNEGALVGYISQHDGIITAMSHICDGHDKTTTVQITWYRMIG